MSSAADSIRPVMKWRGRESMAAAVAVGGGSDVRKRVVRLKSEEDVLLVSNGIKDC